jgi:hypothetical protein
MKKYLRFTCTTCKRFIDKPVDNQRVTPDKCTITLNCQGRLVPIEYRSNAEIATDPEVGVTDWYPRNRTPVATATISDATFINTSTGVYQQLVIGVPLASPPTDTATAALTLQLRSDTPKNYKQYTYRFETTFQNVAGVEAGVEKKTLKFTAYGLNPDIVEVYVNGVKREMGVNVDDYQLYDGTISSLIPPNMVVFNTPVSLGGVTQVDIIVSKAQLLDTTALNFFRNIDSEPRKDKGAWENVSYYDRLLAGVWTRFYLFTCDVLNNLALNPNTIMVPSAPLAVTDVPPVPSVPLSQIYLLLARQPYTKVDRYPDIQVPFDTFSLERDYFKYHNVEGVPTLEITDTALATFYPAARITKFDYEPTIKTPTAGNEEQIVVDGKVVVGPDE